MAANAPGATQPSPQAQAAPEQKEASARQDAAAQPAAQPSAKEAASSETPAKAKTLAKQQPSAKTGGKKQGTKSAKKAQAAKGAKTSTKKATPAKPAAKAAAKPAAKPVAKPAAAAAQPAGQAVKKDDAPKTFPVSNVPNISKAKAAKLPVADAWQPLKQRLIKDGVDKAYLRAMFGRLGDSYSHVPMGTKINELFSYKYMPRPPRKTTPSVPKSDPPVYRWTLKPENVAKCKEYLERHKAAFAAMEKEFGIPKEVVAGLLMVETKLGTYLGSSSSFWSLACLAAADTPERVDPTLQALPLPMTPDKVDWVTKLLRERSAWAYKELLALIKFCRANDLDPLVMPGSVYGAIGICQFMPTNLPKFAVDGNKDGKIDLFDPADAIPSVGNYLKKHGWEGEDRAVHHKVIKRYNKSNVYANTILALAEAIVAPPVDPAAVASAETAAKAGTGKNTAAGNGAKAAKPAAKKGTPSKKATKTDSSGKGKTGKGKTATTEKAPAKSDSSTEKPTLGPRRIPYDPASTPGAPSITDMPGASGQSNQPSGQPGQAAPPQTSPAQNPPAPQATGQPAT